MATENCGGVQVRAPGPEWSLTLFDWWDLRHGSESIAITRREQRLLALLALQGGRPRGYLAGMLWPESTEQRASGNLRAAVWRIDQTAPGVLMHDRSRLMLSPQVRVDVDGFLAAAGVVCGADAQDRPYDRVVSNAVLAGLTTGELLPGWYDDWVLFERSRLQQLRLHALEQLAAQAADAGEFSTALAAASAAVAIEPLRESAQRTLIRTHIRDGNYHSALHAYQAFRARVRSELGVPPSRQLENLVRPLLDGRAAVPPRRLVQPALS